MSSVPSTTNAPHALLSDSFIEHLIKIGKGHSHFWKQCPNGKWCTIPKKSDEHGLRTCRTINVIRDLQARGK